MKIKIERITEMKCPFWIVAEGAVDWTHFVYIHRRSHKRFEILAKEGPVSVIFYRARLLFPLPLFKNYIVIRNERPEVWGYEQVYIDLKTYRKTYLKAKTVHRGITSSIDAEFFYELPDWAKPFSGLFFVIFKLRMRAVMKEDNVYMSERIRLEDQLKLGTQKTCEVQVPHQFLIQEGAEQWV